MTNRHRLLLFKSIARRGVLRSIVLSVFLLLVLWGDVQQEFLGEQRVFVLLLLVITIVVTAYYAMIGRLANVKVTSKHIVVRGHWLPLRIPHDYVVSVKSSTIEEHYPVETMRFGELNRLGPLYEQSCLQLSLKEYPFGTWRQRLFPRFFFTTQFTGVLLLVEDWVALSQQIVEASIEAQPEVVDRRLPSPYRAPVNGEFDRQTIADIPLVLIADDSPAQANHIERILRVNYRTIVVSDGIEALRQARNAKPDLIITDVHLPRLSGRDLIASLNKHKHLKNVPVILMADARSKSAVLEALPLGVTDYIIRPYDQSELLFRVRQWLDILDREREMEKRINLLQAKSLSQMSELMRRGELLNFLPATVAQQVMSGQIDSKRQPFRRQRVTVLFIDLVGFTDLSGRLEATLLSEMLNEFLRTMSAVAISYNGTVDKYVGDQVMVLFGAPQEKDEEDQVWEAAQTAVHMLKEINDLNEIWRIRLPAPLSARIGFNIGYCTAGVFGNEMLQSYTVVGEAVNIASRLQSAAEPNTILCSRETFDYIESRVLHEAVGELQLKGVPYPVDAYRILDTLDT